MEDIWGERGKRECRTTKEREREREGSGAALLYQQCLPQFISAVLAAGRRWFPSTALPVPPPTIIPPTYTSYPTLPSSLITSSAARLTGNIFNSTYM